MIVSRGETYNLWLFKRVPNSSYEYEDTASLCFKGRPARNSERNYYSIQKGFANGVDEVYIFSSHLPAEVAVGDRVFYLGKFWSVSSVGVYFEEARVVNASVMDSEKLIDKAPKGITLK